MEIGGFGNALVFRYQNGQNVSLGERSLLEHGILPWVMGRVPFHRFAVLEDRCFGCGACIALCPVDVLTLTNKMVYVDEQNCTHCRLCIPSCPVFALKLERSD